MDDEEGRSSGLSGWAWHELGREAERSDQGQSKALSTVAARLRGEVPVDVGTLLANNQALWQQNQELQLQVQNLQAEVQDRRQDFYDLWKWAETAEAELKHLRSKLGNQSTG